MTKGQPVEDMVEKKVQETQYQERHAQRDR